MATTHKTALVTGGTSGIGRGIVEALGREGYDVFFVGTSPTKGKAVEEQLGQGTGRFIRLDLSDLRAVRGFAARFAEDHPVLDLLVNVAGVMLPSRQETAEGHEKTFAIDHLAAFVLSHELAPSLARARHGRIANVSAPARQVLKASLDFEDLQLREGYSQVRAVVNGVHAKTVMTEILADKFRAEGIDVIAFDPGPVKTDISRNVKGVFGALFRTATLFMPRVSKAAVYASTSSEMNGRTGQLVVGTKSQPLRFEPGYKARLWEATVDALPFELA